MNNSMIIHCWKKRLKLHQLRTLFQVNFVHWCSINGHKKDLFHAPIYSTCNFYQSKCLIPSQNPMHCWWIKIKENPKCKLYDNVGNWEKQQAFDIITMTPRGTLGLCCVHIVHLVTYPAIPTLPLTLQLCRKSIGILLMIIKS